MAFNPYFYEKAIAERHAEIRRDMEQSRTLAQSGQGHTFARYVVSKFDSLLAKRDSQAQQRARQQSGACLQEG